jgi:hypothetical protein
VRNTEEAEKASREATLDGKDGDDVKDGDVRKAVWGMIEKSQLAKTIRQDDAKKVGIPPFLFEIHAEPRP